MSRVLSELLGADEPVFSFSIKELEKGSGHQGLDIKLALNIRARVRSKAKELGLDPNDTGTKEYYHALKDLARLHDEHLALTIGVMEGGQPSITAVKKAVDKLKFNRNCWAVKHSALKRILKAKPPKNAMRILGFRSVDSMLKRENLEKLMLTAFIAESPTWRQNYKKSLRKLGPTDFENRRIALLSMNGVHFEELGGNYLRKTGNNVVALTEVGAVGILPLPAKYSAGLTLAVLAFVLQQICKINMATMFLKLHQVSPKFGQLLSRVDEVVAFVAELSGYSVHWHAVLRRYTKGGNLPEWLEPHLNLDDIAWQQAEELLYKIEPSLAFWRGLDWVGELAPDGQPVSFNLLDNAINTLNNFEFNERHYSNFREALWHELIAAYIGEEQIEEKVMDQLEERVSAGRKNELLEVSF